MMNNLRRFVVVLVALASLGVVSAAEKISSMREVRDMAKSAQVLTVADDLYVEGFIVSKHDGRNNEMNLNVHYASIKNYDLFSNFHQCIAEEFMCFGVFGLQGDGSVKIA